MTTDVRGDVLEQAFRQKDPETFPGVPRDSTSSTKDKMRRRAIGDTFFLAEVVLGYSDITAHTHGALCKFLDTALYIRRMILMPRTHFKTTIAVITHTIRLILNDPNHRILVISDTDENAKLMLGEISNHFKYNDLFQWLFPELIPENFNKARWNSNEITVVRPKKHLKEATVTASGAFGAVESKHFTHIKADDLVTEKHIHSDAEMDKLTKWMGGLEPLLDYDGCSIDWVGSRKKKGDSYESVLKTYSGDGRVREIGPFAELRGEIAVFSRSIVENGKRIFPERVSWAYINRMKRFYPERFHAQLANSPKASGLNIFDSEDFRYFILKDDGVIEAWHEGVLLENTNAWALDRIILYDPSVAERNTSSMNAILVLAKGGGPFRYVLESHIGHYKADEAVELLFQLNERWRPTFISIEARGYQGSIKYWIAEKSELQRRDPLPVVEWPPEGSPKAQWAKKEHIRGLQPLFREHFMWFQEDQTELIEQTEYYPNVRWEDGLDALSQGLDYWPYTEDEEHKKKRVDAEDKYLERLSGFRPSRKEEWNEEEFLRQFGPSGYAMRN